MAEKKKKGKAKGKGGEEEDESTYMILRYYKKKCELNGVTVSKLFKKKYDEVTEEGDDMETLQLCDDWGPIGPVGIRAIFDALYDLDYKHLKNIEIWKVEAEDEGVRVLSKFMNKAKTVEKLDLMNNNITPLGCEFLGSILSLKEALPLKELKLDHNVFGSEGLKNLAVGLAINNSIEFLSLNYCGIESDGSKYLQQILAFVDTKLTDLNLQGNKLKNEGIYNIFKGLEVNETLLTLNISDNQFGESEDVNTIEKICEVMRKNTKCGYYDLKYNGIYDQGGKKILEVAQECKHLWRIELPQNLSLETANGFQLAFKKRKQPKRKKKGKKKKKAK